jgi:acylglycerol lipase
MSTKEKTLRSRDGTELHSMSILPDGACAADIAYVHGIGDHLARHLHVADACVARGYAFHAVDLRGHGRSQGRRGFIRSWRDYLDDVDAMIAEIRREASESGTPRGGGRPLFLIGHSMGGVIALDYALARQDELAGLVLTAPAVGAVGISPLRVLLGRLLSRIAPGMRFPTGLDVSGISRDHGFIEATRSDPLYHGVGSPRLATEFAEAAARVRSGAPGLRIPLLILHGEADRLVALEGSRALLAAAGCVDKELLTYPEGFHELDNDLDAEKPLGDLVAWLGRYM